MTVDLSNLNDIPSQTSVINTALNKVEALPQIIDPSKVTIPYIHDGLETNPYPIPQNRVWYIYDSSKIQTFMDCPRKYYYNYMLGWSREMPNLHLVFGESWHQALEHIIRERFSNASLGSAFAVFLKEYRKAFTEEQDEFNHEKAKSPADAFAALQYYHDAFKHEADTRELIDTEIAGTVMVDEARSLSFRIDALFRTKDGILVQEHKTASRKSTQWVDQWFMKVQTGTYTHVANMMFPDETVAGLEINGMVFYKNATKAHDKQEVVRIPVNRSRDMMGVWLWNVKHWLNQIQWNMEVLKDATDNDDILSCFPLNTESCTKYFGCEYLPYCQIWGNPLRHTDRPPPGFKEEWWDPSAREETANTVVHLKEGDE